jgi:gliding motility-associated-like protein
MLENATVPQTPEWENTDCDGDGVINGQELIDGTDPLNMCDFVLDNQSVTPSQEWLDADCDNDGLNNGGELDEGTDPLNPDTDGDGVLDGTEVADGTAPLDICDYLYASQTVTPSAEWNSLDCDGDGVTNSQEVLDGTDPTDLCDYDFNSQDITIVSQQWLDSDCDNDGIINGDELGDNDDDSTPDYDEVNNGDPNAEDGLEYFDIMTPNGDGLNDVFVIRGIHKYPNNTLEIFNRWGVKVYETQGYGVNDNFFRGYSDGRVTISRGERLPVGTYYFVLNYVNDAGQNKQLAGPLYINRR